MKNIVFFLSFIFSSNVFALDSTSKDIKALCGLAEHGEYSKIQRKAQIQADGSVKLASIGGKGEISFSKGDWDGVNQVLQEHQAGDNKDYRACVANALPYFKRKLTTTKSSTAVEKTSDKKDTLTIGKQEAKKIINVGEMHGNIDMGQ